MNDTMDLIFYNGTVHTMDKRGNTAEAVGIKDGKICFVGSSDEALKADCPVTIDLKGKCVLPGFTDTYIHAVTYAWYENSPKFHNASSVDEIIEISKKFLKEKDYSNGKWLIGRGWNQHKFNKPEIFTRKELDSISTEIPIAFLRVCGHISVVNSKALDIILKMNEAKPLMKDIDTETGIMMENAARLFLSAIPPYGKEDLKELLRFSERKLNKCGITSIHSDDIISLRVRSRYEVLDAFRDMAESGELSVRTYCMLSYNDRKDLDQYIKDGLKTGQGDAFCKIGPVKIVMDGSLGGKTAALLEPYANTENNYGVAYFNVDELSELISFLNGNGLDVIVHAIGDRAMDTVVKAVEVCNGQRKNDRRPGIIHAQISSTEILKDMAKENIQAFVQPVFVGSDMDFAESVVSDPKNKKIYAWKSMLGAGVAVSGSACSPVESFDILENIQFAVTREKLNGGPENGWMPEEKLSVEEAVRMFTAGGAYASYEENVKGSLEKGKYADMVVLSEDIFQADKHKIKDIKIEKTLVDGKIVWDLERGAD